MKLFNYDISITKIKPRTAIHPDYKTLIEFAFELDGKKYYEFRNISDMPKDRFIRANEFLINCEWSLTTDDLKEFIQLMDKSLEKGNITEIARVNNALSYSVDLFMDTDIYLRLFSCVFFTVDEDLTDYDFDIGAEKIKAFKKYGIPDFFLNQPIKKYLPQIDISKQHIETFSKLTTAKKDYLHTVKSKVIGNLS
jgi:hypothetical protein